MANGTRTGLVRVPMHESLSNFHITAGIRWRMEILFCAAADREQERCAAELRDDHKDVVAARECVGREVRAVVNGVVDTARRECARIVRDVGDWHVAEDAADGFASVVKTDPEFIRARREEAAIDHNRPSRRAPAEPPPSQTFAADADVAKPSPRARMEAMF